MQLLIDDKRKTITIPRSAGVEDLMNFCKKMDMIRGWRILQDEIHDHSKFTLPSRDWTGGVNLKKPKLK